MRTVQEIEALAPGASAVKNAKKLAKPEPWRRLGREVGGREEGAVWGVALGSKGDTYAVHVSDGGAEALRCSCPSRQRPCKHALALALLAASGYEFEEEALPKGHRYAK